MSSDHTHKVLLAIAVLLLIWGCEESSSSSASKQALSLRADYTGNGYNFTIDTLKKSGLAIYADDTPLVEELWSKLRIRWGFRRKSAKGDDTVYWVQKSEADPDSEHDYPMTVADKDKAIFIPQKLPDALRGETEIEVYATAEQEGNFSYQAMLDLPENFASLVKQAVTVSGLIANQTAIAEGRSQDRNVAEAGVYFIHKSTGTILQVFSDASGRYSIRLSYTGSFVLAVLHQHKSFQPYVTELSIDTSISDQNVLLSELASGAAMTPKQLYDISSSSLNRIAGSGQSVSGITTNLKDNTPVPKALLLFYDLAAAEKTYVLQSATDGTFSTNLPTSKKLSFTPSAYGYVPNIITQTLNEEPPKPPIDLDVVGLRPIPPSSDNPQTPADNRLDAPDIRFSSPTAHSIPLLWDAVGHVSSYKVSWGTDSDAVNGSTATVRASVSSYIVGNLSADTRYYVKVQAIAASASNYRDSLYSRILSTKTARVTASGQTPLAVPTSLQVTAVSSSSISATWDAVTNASGYEISWGTDSNASNRGTESASRTSHTFGNLSEGTQYYFKVRASGTGNYAGSAYSTPPVSATTAKIVLATPTPVGMVTTTITANSMAFTWSAVAHTSRYQVSWGTDPQATNGGTGQTSFGYTLRNLSPNTRYYAKVKALGTGGGYADSPYNSPRSDTTYSLVLSGAPTITLGIVTSNSIAVSWTAMSNAPGYMISWGTDAQANNGNVADSSNRNSSNRTYTIKNLTPDTLYYIKVKGIDRGNRQDGPYSSPIFSARTTTIPLALPRVSVGTITQDSITISWGAVNHASSYEIAWGIGSTASHGSPVTVGASVTSHAINGLSANTRYYIKVQAIAASTSSYASSGYHTVNATTMDILATPSAPTMASSMSSSTPSYGADWIDLSWNAVPNATGYVLAWGRNTNASRATAATNATSYRIFHLTPNTRYYVKVKATATGSYVDSAYSAVTPINRPPEVSITKLSASAVTEWIQNRSYYLHATGSDYDGDTLSYEWSISSTSSGFTRIGTGLNFPFDTTGRALGDYTIWVQVSDSQGGWADDKMKVRIRTNQAPVLNVITPAISTSYSSNSVFFTFTSSDGDNDTVKYTVLYSIHSGPYTKIPALTDRTNNQGPDTIFNYEYFSESVDLSSILTQAGAFPLRIQATDGFDTVSEDINVNITN